MVPIPAFRFSYWVDGPIVFTVSIVGIIANIITVTVLTRQRSKVNIFNAMYRLH